MGTARLESPTRKEQWQALVYTLGIVLLVVAACIAAFWHWSPER